MYETEINSRNLNGLKLSDSICYHVGRINTNYASQSDIPVSMLLKYQYALPVPRDKTIIVVELQGDYDLNEYLWVHYTNEKMEREQFILFDTVDRALQFRLMYGV